MRYEIGSHFELSKEYMNFNDSDDWIPKGQDYTYTFSGRAAIELAIKDIIKRQDIKNVYMPAYSCYSMVEPFIKYGIQVFYYDVNHSKEGLKYEINYNTQSDVFFAMTYFGLEDATKMDNIIKKFVKKGTVVIEDITHRLLSRESHSGMAHYSVASLRKWLPMPAGGYITKYNGQLACKPNKKSDQFVIPILNAMNDKYKYLRGSDIKKKHFLKTFASFGKKIKTISKDYMIDKYSFNIVKNIDIDKIRMRRRENAQVLYKGLKSLNIIKTLIPNPNLNYSCPLFVPIIVSQKQRNDLRTYLIENNIFCPIHWPRVSNYTNVPGIELSLICDQRYSADDMRYILNKIKKWYDKIS